MSGWSKRYIVFDAHGAILGIVARKSSYNARNYAEHKYGDPGCTVERTWMTRELFHLWLEERGRCHLCHGGVPALVSEGDPRAASADHLMPRKFGGVASRDNVRLAHRFCNSRRGHLATTAMAPATYAALLDNATRGWPAAPVPS